jgi:serine/threonine protein kinase
MAEATPWQPEQALARGRFVLVNRLGRGGMGEVWLARDERLHEPVALKLLPPEIRGDPGALDDLRRETARSHKLSHPNIVRIHDLCEDAGGTAFIVMEYIDGPTLAALRLEQPSRVLSWDYLRPLVGQLCAALEYAHGEKVIHRDLKPANLMVDSRGRLKLADFGIAAVVSDSMSRVSVHHLTSGTLPYMSPQQVRGQRPQAADDIYALGATLYELLTGSLPFYSGDITHQVLHEAPEPVDERLAVLEIENSVPLEVSAMVMACLAKEPGQRPQSAGAVAGRVGVLESRASPYEALEKSVFSNTEATSVAAPPSKPGPLAAPVSRGTDRFPRVEKAPRKPGLGHEIPSRDEAWWSVVVSTTLGYLFFLTLFVGWITWPKEDVVRYWESNWTKLQLETAGQLWLWKVVLSLWLLFILLVTARRFWRRWK